MRSASSAERFYGKSLKDAAGDLGITEGSTRQGNVFISARAGVDLTLPILPVLRKRLTITGSTLRGRSADEKARLAEAVERTVWPWIEAKRLRPIIDAEYALMDAATAHERMEAGSHVGKVIRRANKRP
jgi:NADPH2:quinone reductase